MPTNNNSKNNVSVGKPKVGGAVWRAPSGTSLPASADASLGGSFVCMGYLSTDGLTNNNAREHTEIKAWGGDIVAVPMTGHSDKFSGTFIESLNTEVLKASFGDANVSGSIGSGISVTANAADDTEFVYVADMELYGGVKKRVVIPAGIVTEVGEVTYKDDEVIGYPLTITALPDSSGNTHYEYIKQSSGT